MTHKMAMKNQWLTDTETNKRIYFASLVHTRTGYIHMLVLLTIASLLSILRGYAGLGRGMDRPDEPFLLLRNQFIEWLQTKLRTNFSCQTLPDILQGSDMLVTKAPSNKLVSTAGGYSKCFYCWWL